MEAVFKALADPSRRALLDALRDTDGQTLSELERCLPQMTRFGVMKHLRVLEDADLVTTRKVGREKHHSLNPVPIRLLHDRWLTRFTTAAARSLIALKNSLEVVPVADAPSKVFQIYIETTPEELWTALTDGAYTKQYYFGTAVASSWEKGAPYAYADADGNELLVGEVLEADPPRRLVTTFDPKWFGEPQPPSTVAFEIEDHGGVCRLLVVHDGLLPGTQVEGGVSDGWPQILSGLKTLLESGRPMVQPAADAG